MTRFIGVVATVVALALSATAWGEDAPAAAPEAKAATAKAEGSSEAAAPAAQKEVTQSPEGCTVERYTIHSDAMDLDIKVAVVLPPEYASNPEKKYPILYTLHGSRAPYDTYANMGLLRAALKEKPMIVTCFDANDSRSGYSDSPDNPKSKFTTFFFKEFVPYIDAHYRTNGQRGVTGFSMGGGGAFHYMCTKPDMFVGVSALSQGFRRGGQGRGPGGPPPGGENKDAPKAPEGAAPEGAAKEGAAKDAAAAGAEGRRPRMPAGEDVYTRMEKLLADKVKLPHLLIGSGTEDQMGLAGARAFSAFLKEKGVEFEYSEAPGAHKWAYWLSMSPMIVDFHWRTFQPGYKVIEHPNPAATEAKAAEGESKAEEKK